MFRLFTSFKANRMVEQMWRIHQMQASRAEMFDKMIMSYAKRKSEKGSEDE